MSTVYERIDMDTLRRDSQLNGLINKIKDDLMKGCVVEIKTSSQNQLENNSKQSSRISSMSNSMIHQPILQPHDKVIDQEDAVLLSSSKKKSQITKLTKSIYNQPPKVKSEMIKPIILDDNIEIASEQTNQSLQEDEEPITIENVSKKLDDLSDKISKVESTQLIEKIQNIQSQLFTLLEQNKDSQNYQFVYSVQTIRSNCVLVKLFKSIGNFKNAIKQLKQIRSKFKILDPNLQGQIMIELGKLYFLNQQYQEANEIFLEGLLHYEKLQWKSEIAHILLQMSKINSQIKHFDTAKKLCQGSISILKEFLPENDEQIAEAYIILGECHYLAKEHEPALEILQKAVSIKLKKYNTYKHLEFVQVFNLLGLVYGLIPDVQQSLYYFLQALQCFKKNSFQRAQILNNIAVIFQNQGLTEKALRCSQVALEIYKSILPEKHSQMQRLTLNQTCLQPMQ